MDIFQIRPESGELTIGQSVIVKRAPNDRRSHFPEYRYISAKVVKIDRVWVNLEAMESGLKRTWRMRQDTQDEGAPYSGWNASFATLDQHAWDTTRNWAVSLLRDHGITVEERSPWRGREIQLANILVKARCAPGRDRPARVFSD